MLILSLILVATNQNGLANMCAAGRITHEQSTCSPSRRGYLQSTQSVTLMRINATNMARILCKNSEMMEVAVNSTDPAHRVAVAFAKGISMQPDESLFMLATDENPLVSQAAREALVSISLAKFRKQADFGPFPLATDQNKQDSANLWRIYYNTQDNKYKQETQIKQQTMPITTQINENEKDFLPPVKVVKSQTEIIDDSIPGFRIKRITTSR